MSTSVKIILGFVVVLIVATAGWFISYYPSLSPQKQPEQNQNAQQVQESISKYPTESAQITPTQFGPDAVSAIKAYAAKQFNISEKELVVTTSEKQQWKTTCFDLAIEDKTCEDKPTSGYEVTFEIKGQRITYRGNDEGTSVRVVKK